MRRQQSPRVQPGASCKIVLIASRFFAGPSLIPAISNWWLSLQQYWTYKTLTADETAQAILI
jgi:hypothetical protein